MSKVDEKGSCSRAEIGRYVIRIQMTALTKTEEICKNGGSEEDME